MIRKCRIGEEPAPMFRRDKPLSTVKHELFIQQRAKRFDEDYAVVKKLGEGSFGLVYEVIQKSLGIKRALKIVRNTSNDIYSTREEIDVLSHMDHPNVLKLYEYY
jgi:serine/threonine protein kinase